MELYNIKNVKKLFQERDPKVKDVKELEINGERSLPNGKSYFSCKCPFCFNTVDIQKWSFTTTGKKCWKCGAVLRGKLAVLK